MTTKLNSPFKRELDVNGEKYTLTISPEGLKLVVKGKRKGIELSWASLVGGEAALVTALNASIPHPGMQSMGSPGRDTVKH